MSRDLTPDGVKKLTWRVHVREVSLKTYEIDCVSEDEARQHYCEGILVRNELDYDDIEECKAIDIAEMQR